MKLDIFAPGTNHLTSLIRFTVPSCSCTLEFYHFAILNNFYSDNTQPPLQFPNINTKMMNVIDEKGSNSRKTPIRKMTQKTCQQTKYMFESRRWCVFTTLYARSKCQLTKGTAHLSWTATSRVANLSSL